MKYKLIAVDMDGTLIDSALKVTPRVEKAIKDYQALGGYFTVVTGRMASGVLKNMRGYTPNAPIMLYQGATAIDLSGKVLYEKPIDNATCVEILEYCKEKGLTVNAYHDDVLCVFSYNERVKKYCEISKNRYIACDIHSLFLQNGWSTPKLLVICPPEEGEGFRKMLAEKYADKLFVCNSNPSYNEINAVGVTKGAAIEYLASYLGIDVSETVAIGDGTNDVPMIKRAGLGVAMANSLSGVKEYADYVTLSNDEDGVAVVIEKIMNGEL